MQQLKLFSFLLLCFLLVACSGGGGSDSPDAPKIGNIYTDIMHGHTSFYDKWGEYPNRTIRFLVSVDVTDPQGLANIADIYIVKGDGDWFWDMLGGSNNVRLSDCYNANYQVFECWFYDSRRLDSIDLRSWKLVAEDNDGNVTEKSFTFKLPGGDEPESDDLFAYSSEYDGSKTFGVPALEAMTVTENDIVFTSNPGTQSFRLEFETKDTRAKRYDFSFYDGSSEIDYIAYACACSPSIESTPIIFGHKVVLDLPWSEISFDKGYEASDINGVHIRLLDEPVDWELPEATGLWFNHTSYSEFVTLEP